MCTTAASAVCISSDGEALTTSAIFAEAVSGSHVLLIKGFSRTKGNGNGKFFRSSSFTVGGQLWYMKFYPYGDRSESADWISLYVQLDDSDDVEVKARLKFSVLDDMGGSVPTFSRESSSLDIFCSKNRCYGFPKFVTRKALEESSYIRDDCLKVRCDLTVSKDIRAEATKQFVLVPPSNMHLQFGSLLSGAVGADELLRLQEICLLHTGVCWLQGYRFSWQSSLAP